MSPMNEATSWPDAAVAIAGIGMVTALGLRLFWQIFVTLRAHVTGKAKAANGVKPVNGAVANGE